MVPFGGTTILGNHHIGYNTFLLDTTTTNLCSSFRSKPREYLGNLQSTKSVRFPHESVRLANTGDKEFMEFHLRAAVLLSRNTRMKLERTLRTLLTKLRTLQSQPPTEPAQWIDELNELSSWPPQDLRTWPPPQAPAASTTWQRNQSSAASGAANAKKDR